MSINVGFLITFFLLFVCFIGYYAYRKNKNPLFFGALSLVPGLNVMVLFYLYFAPSSKDKENAKLHENLPSEKRKENTIKYLRIIALLTFSYLILQIFSLGCLQGVNENILSVIMLITITMMVLSTFTLLIDIYKVFGIFWVVVASVVVTNNPFPALTFLLQMGLILYFYKKVIANNPTETYPNRGFKGQIKS